MGVLAKLLIIIMSIFDALREMIRDEIEDIFDVGSLQK